MNLSYDTWVGRKTSIAPPDFISLSPPGRVKHSTGDCEQIGFLVRIKQSELDRGKGERKR
jgi:hypothetical protein